MSKPLIADHLDGQQREQLESWAQECREHPGVLPHGCEVVQSRLIRAVGRATLPGGSEVYLKVMGFPRRKDRWRYMFRSLPSTHEASALLRLRAAGIPCPRPLYSLAVRRGRSPMLSFLVLEGFEVVDRRPDLCEVAHMAASLARLGLFHPDLNPGNFLTMTGGSLAVIDLQSARWRPSPLRRGLRLRMAAKLWAERQSADDPQALVDAGLVGQTELDQVCDRAESLRVAHLRGRILRCLRTSSEFRVERRWNGTSYRRRAYVDESCLQGGRELRKLWVGDRACQVLDGAVPIFSSLFMKSWWLPGRHSLYYPHAQEADFMATKSQVLLGGFRRFHDLAKRVDD